MSVPLALLPSTQQMTSEQYYCCGNLTPGYLQHWFHSLWTFDPHKLALSILHRSSLLKDNWQPLLSFLGLCRMFTWSLCLVPETHFSCCFSGFPLLFLTIPRQCSQPSCLAQLAQPSSDLSLLPPSVPSDREGWFGPWSAWVQQEPEFLYSFIKTAILSMHSQKCRPISQRIAPRDLPPSLQFPSDPSCSLTPSGAKKGTWISPHPCHC